MINLWEVFAIIFIHWVGDFVFQSDWQAKNKSKNNKALLQHITRYTTVWAAFILIWVIGDIIVNLFDTETTKDYIWTAKWLPFLSITFIAHFITDYFTSRLNSRLWAEGKIHNFFVSIGFDQILHYVQLFLTYYLLFK